MSKCRLNFYKSFSKLRKCVSTSRATRRRLRGGLSVKKILLHSLVSSKLACWRLQLFKWLNFKQVKIAVCCYTSSMLLHYSTVKLNPESMSKTNFILIWNHAILKYQTLLLYFRVVPLLWTLFMTSTLVTDWRYATFGRLHQCPIVKNTWVLICVQPLA